MPPKYLPASPGRQHALSIVLLILVTIGLRLPALNDPITGWHAWRQTDTAAIARNFVREDNNLFHPRVDWRGGTDGEIESEFPLYSWVTAQAQSVFGMDDAWARVPAIVSSVLAVLGILGLATMWFSRPVGHLSAWTLTLLPLSVYFGRVPMPDMSMLAAQIWGLLLFDRYLVRGGVWRLAIAAICVSLAGLLKLPALYIGLPLVGTLVARRGWSGFADLRLWLAGIFVLGSTAAWYAHAHSWGGQSGLSFGIWSVGTDKFAKWSLLVQPEFYRRVFLQHLIERVLTYGGAVAVAIGLFTMPRGMGRNLILLWIAGLGVFVVVAAGGLFPHDYYLIPFMAPAAILIAVAAQQFTNRARPRALRALIALAVLATIILSVDRIMLLYSKENPQKTSRLVALVVRESTTEEDRILVISGGSPESLYYAARHGWMLRPGSQTVEAVDRILDRGVQAVILDRYVVPPDNLDEIESRLGAHFRESEHIGTWIAFTNPVEAEAAP